MIAPPLALSLSNSVTEIGAIAAFAALLGIAILSLLVFSQAREIKRLREWAGRAPERAAEMEQRVSADAAARMQRGGAVAPAARVVPRKTPLVSAPVSTAVNATVAAVVPAATDSPAQATAPEPGDSAQSPPATTAPEGQPGGGQSTESALASDALAANGEARVAGETVSAQSPQPATALPTPSAQSATESTHPAVTPAAEQSGDHPATPAPATAAARVAGVSARSPLPPSPSAPAPPGAPASSLPSDASIPPTSAPKPASRPPAPMAAARRVPSRAVGGTSGPQARSPSPSRALPAAAGGGVRTGVTRPATAAGAAGPKYFKPERSSGRRVALIVGGVIVGVLVLVFAVSALKGGGGPHTTATQSSLPQETQPASSHTTRTAHAVVTNPAETAVVVLNGTATAGLAHHLAADLQQSGYTRAAASAGVPPGTHAITVVEYARGHRADAQAVARKLNVTKVDAIEASIASLTGSSTVVVLAGADQAAEFGGGGAHSNGEPAAGTAGGQ